MTTDLAAFVNARLDEAEQVAHAAGGEEWVGLDVDGFVRARTPDGAFISGVLWTDEVAHIVQHDPARVLAEVAAKRRIVRLHTGDHGCSTYDHNGENDHYASVIGDDCSTVRLLASVYADHEGYREEWKP